MRNGGLADEVHVSIFNRECSIVNSFQVSWAVRLRSIS